MASKLPSAKISDLTVEIDTSPVDTPMGEVAWATVAITYVSAGVEPTLAIRVPVPWAESDKKQEALRRARALIDHACGSSDLNMAPKASADVFERAPFNGLMQELGIAPPTTKPVRGRE